MATVPTNITERAPRKPATLPSDAFHWPSGGGHSCFGRFGDNQPSNTSPTMALKISPSIERAPLGIPAEDAKGGECESGAAHTGARPHCNGAPPAIDDGAAMAFVGSPGPSYFASCAAMASNGDGGIAGLGAPPRLDCELNCAMTTFFAGFTYSVCP